MKDQKILLIMMLVVLFLFRACSPEPGIDKSKFAKLNIAARAVKTSIAADASYQQLTDRVRQLSIEITALENRVTTKEEKELLKAYSDLLVIYKDGLLLWKYKSDFPFFDPVLKERIYVGQDAEPIVLKYGFSTESHVYEPTGQQWKSISVDSIRVIWSNADSQLKIIENITNY